jgi:RND superfamily putative drug exporter
MFARLGRWCYDHRRLVPAVWLGALLVLGGVLGAVGTKTKTDFDLPDVESRRATDVLTEHFPGAAGAGMGGRLVFESDTDLRDPELHAPLVAFLDAVAAIDITSAGDRPDVTVTDPFAEGGAHQISGDGRIAYADVELPADFTIEQAKKVRKEIEKVEPETETTIILGGQTFAEFEPPNSEILGLAFGMVILLLAFGSVLAMGLPIGVALFGIGAGTIAAGFLSHVVSPPDFASTLGIMIGLGVGIDYALFIVTRFRENLHRGLSVRDSVAVALDTAGRAVLFAGTTVVISLMGMLIMGMGFVTGLAVNAATVVAATMVASLTLLPALMGLAGPKVEVTRWRGLIAAGFVAVALVGVGLKVMVVAVVALALAVLTVLLAFAVRPLREEVPRRQRRELRETFAYRWSRVIQHHPWRSVIGGTLVLVLLALPLFGMRLGFSDEGNYATDTEARQAYDLLAEGFGPGSNGQIIVVTEIPADATAAELLVITRELGDDEGVALASPPVLSGVEPDPIFAGPEEPTAIEVLDSVTRQLESTPRPKAALYAVTPTTAPQDERTTELVHRLRDEVIPFATADTSLDPAVGGFVAVAVDFSDYLAQRLPYFLVAVLALSFILLMVVFRSLLVPLKAVIMNLLSIGAAYGVVVAVFQWGWGGDLIGIAEAPIEPFMPMMLFAIVFGLSMDYEVFLLSRVKEEFDRTGDSRESVADGLAATALVITAAALIMVFVFGSFLLEDDRTVKLMGTGLATAILIDATIVRMLLVPATMELLGDKNWWLPGWLDRILPNIDVEGHAHLDPAPTPDQPPA